MRCRRPSWPAHRDKGVEFRLGREATAIGARHVTLDDGSRLPADLVVLGIGVEPRTGLAEAAGLTVEDGVVVDANLRTSDPDIFAAGDIARWPDPHTGRDIRVEHWVVAQRQGQVAAANMLGQPTPFAEVPFFWSKHFDLSLRYVGHAGGRATDRLSTARRRSGTPPSPSAATGASLEASRHDGKRDLESLEREAAMERLQAFAGLCRGGLNAFASRGALHAPAVSAAASHALAAGRLRRPGALGTVEALLVADGAFHHVDELLQVHEVARRVARRVRVGHQRGHEVAAVLDEEVTERAQAVDVFFQGSPSGKRARPEGLASVHDTGIARSSRKKKQDGSREPLLLRRGPHSRDGGPRLRVRKRRTAG